MNILRKAYNWLKYGEIDPILDPRDHRLQFKDAFIDKEEELDKVAEMLNCRPGEVAMIIEDFLDKNCCSGGGCAGNGLCCWYMEKRK